MSVFPSKVNFVTGDILTATDVNEIGQAINLLDGAQFAAGKNKFINGDFGVWQRGTSISTTTGASNYGADRFRFRCDFSAGTSTFTQQTFTPGTAPVAGYEGQFFGRLTCGSTSTYANINQRIEDVRTLAGQTATLSYWAKASAAITLTPTFAQNFGSGGSGTVFTFGTAVTLTTSWVRYTTTVSVPSITGKTIGTTAFLEILFELANNLNSATIDLWGVQVEAAQTASPFQTATGTKQGELAACQRYYVRFTGGTAYAPIGMGYGESATNVAYNIMLPVTPRTNITTIEYSNVANSDGASTTTVTNLVVLNGGTQVVSLRGSQASGITQYRPYGLINSNNAAGYVAFSAEL
jgi:hypothetical protein